MSLLTGTVALSGTSTSLRKEERSASAPIDAPEFVESGRSNISRAARVAHISHSLDHLWGRQRFRMIGPDRRYAARRRFSMRVKMARPTQLVSAYAKRFGRPVPASLLKSASLLGRPPIAELLNQLQQSLNEGRPVPGGTCPRPRTRGRRRGLGPRELFGPRDYDSSTNARIALSSSRISRLSWIACFV